MSGLAIGPKAEIEDWPPSSRNINETNSFTRKYR